MYDYGFGFTAIVSEVQQSARNPLEDCLHFAGEGRGIPLDVLWHYWISSSIVVLYYCLVERILTRSLAGGSFACSEDSIRQDFDHVDMCSSALRD